MVKTLDYEINLANIRALIKKNGEIHSLSSLGRDDSSNSINSNQTVLNTLNSV